MHINQNQYFKWGGTSPQFATSSAPSKILRTLSRFELSSCSLSATKLSWLLVDLNVGLRSLWTMIKYFLKLNLSLLRASTVAAKAGRMPAFSNVLSKKVAMFLLSLNENGEGLWSSKLNLSELTWMNPFFISKIRFCNPVSIPKMWCRAQIVPYW